MYSVEVTASFSSAHRLRGYRGKCEALHGHNWRVTVMIASNKLDKIGMLIDFKRVKKALAKVMEKMDHKFLNSLPYFKKINPTSENIAKYIYQELHKGGLKVGTVTVWESENCRATYAQD
ncbi:MAG: 6-carboxytetrahydropterin synthase QueD [Candidatus Omnitrophica bacterium]|nr:6-carboxytetrahydropterin synthase QueD [Candidatus Omnitrophota bacterium]